jgi:hypothetical protein
MKQTVRGMMLVTVLFASTVAVALDGSSKDAAYFVDSNEEPAQLDASSKDAAFTTSLWEFILSLVG